MPQSMQNWMLDDGKIEVVTNWEIDLPIVIKGDMHGIPFENWGVVKRFEPENLLQYSHLSSLSVLPDVIASYTVITFELMPNEGRTMLSLTLNNFPTFEIYKHLDFYWNMTLPIIKAFAEQD